VWYGDVELPVFPSGVEAFEASVEVTASRVLRVCHKKIGGDLCATRKFVRTSVPLT
jgi:hypothetical protein